MLIDCQALNYPCTLNDSDIVFEMCSEDFSTTRSRKPRAPQRQVPKLYMQNAPSLLKNESIRLFIEFLRINEIIFSHAMTETLGVRVSQTLPNRFKESLLLFAQEVMSFYQ